MGSNGMTKDIKLIIPCVPVAKPRMTRRDKWMLRPCVVRYRQFADIMTNGVGSLLPQNPESVSWRAFFPMPESWSKKKKDVMRGKIHREKPDRDNLDKGILDALWKDDKGIAIGSLVKLWDDGNGPRIELRIRE